MRTQFEHLSFDEMHSLAPSIFAETPHESRSDRYAYIPTIQIVEGMRKKVFCLFPSCKRGAVANPAESTQSICPVPSRRNVKRHSSCRTALPGDRTYQLA